MLRVRSRIHLGLVISAFMPGCTTGGDGSSSDAAARSPAREPKDPCSLITEAEAEELLGADLNVTSKPESSGGPPSCIYAPTTSRMNGFTMTVYWRGGKEALDVVKGGMSIATTLMKTDEPDVNSMMKLQPVEGVGDEAYFNPMAGTSVLKGDTMLEFDIRGMMWHRKMEEGLETWKQLVEKALSRL